MSAEACASWEDIQVCLTMIRAKTDIFHPYQVLFTFLLFIFYFYVYGRFACMYVYITHVCLVRLDGDGPCIADDCKLLCRCYEMNPSPGR